MNRFHHKKNRNFLLSDICVRKLKKKYTDIVSHYHSTCRNFSIIFREQVSYTHFIYFYTIFTFIKKIVLLHFCIISLCIDK